MTPSHSNKDGVRYRYYVSHVLLQCRKKNAGRVTRVPAIQLENLVVEARQLRPIHYPTRAGHLDVVRFGRSASVVSL
jgi:hypothetical protein